jgi:hypothetical protein
LTEQSPDPGTLVETFLHQFEAMDFTAALSNLTDDVPCAAQAQARWCSWSDWIVIASIMAGESCR